MGNARSSMDLDGLYFNKPMPPKAAPGTIHIINVTLPNPYTGEPADTFHFGIKASSGPSNATCGFRRGHASAAEAVYHWRPEDHTKDFLVIEGEGKYARGQLVGTIIDETTHSGFTIAWDHPKDGLECLCRDDYPVHVPQHFDWDRGENEMTYVREQLGLGDEILLIQGDSVKVIRDVDTDADADDADAGASCVFVPGLDRNLNDFTAMVQAEQARLKKKKKRGEPKKKKACTEATSP